MEDGPKDITLTLSVAEEQKKKVDRGLNLNVHKFHMLALCRALVDRSAFCDDRELQVSCVCWLSAIS